MFYSGVSTATTPPPPANQIVSQNVSQNDNPAITVSTYMLSIQIL